MSPRLQPTLLLALSVCRCLIPSLAQYGHVDFKTSCDPIVTNDFNAALSRLYSFEYGQAKVAFDQISSQDPDCCIAYFMAASSFTHPIWTFISDDDFKHAATYSMRATECAQKSRKITQREKGYIRALAVYANVSDPAVAEPAARLQAYADAMKRDVYTWVETDINAGILYGLALLAVGYYNEHEPADGFPHLTEAGRIQEHMMARDPNAPGALHYIVHAYDQPATATKALAAAHALERNSLAVPHAIHMPSHIYSDRGLWNLSVRANMNSLNKAYQAMGNFTGPDWFHGAYFLQFALLQLAMDCDARKLVQHFQLLAVQVPTVFFRHLESIVRVPVMLIVETRDWEHAAAFDLETLYNTSSAAVWDQNTWTRIYANFLNVVGKCVLGHPVADIQASSDALQQANKTLWADGSWVKLQMPYYRLSFEIMVRGALAWKQFRLVSFKSGIDAMIKVCTFQSEAWHPEIGHTWDCHEQLAEMYLLRNGPGDLQSALAAYELAYTVYPNRFGSMAGAGRCAQLLGDKTKACSYYSQLTKLTCVSGLPVVSFDGLTPADCPKYLPDRRPELIIAHAYLQDNCQDANASFTLI